MWDIGIIRCTKEPGKKCDGICSKTGHGQCVFLKFAITIRKEDMEMLKEGRI